MQKPVCSCCEVDAGFVKSRVECLYENKEGQRVSSVVSCRRFNSLLEAEEYF